MKVPPRGYKEWGAERVEIYKRMTELGEFTKEEIVKEAIPILEKYGIKKSKRIRATIKSMINKLLKYKILEMNRDKYKIIKEVPAEEIRERIRKMEEKGSIIWIARRDLTCLLNAKLEVGCKQDFYLSSIKRGLISENGTSVKKNKKRINTYGKVLRKWIEEPEPISLLDTYFLLYGWGKFDREKIRDDLVDETEKLINDGFLDVRGKYLKISEKGLEKILA